MTENTVAVYYSNKDVRLEKRPIPSIRDGEILIRVHASGLCGSDILEWYRKPRAPFVPGHEVSGEVVENRSPRKELKPGTLVVTTHHVPCLTCRFCTTGRETACETLRNTSFDPGGFAEYIRIPALNVLHGTFLVETNIPPEVACLTEPLGCVVRAHRKMGLHPRDTFLVIGSGVSGLLHIILSRLRGIKWIGACDVVKERLDQAKAFGAHDVFFAQTLEQELQKKFPQGVDKIAVCTGSKHAMTSALNVLAPGGTLLFFASLMPGDHLKVPVHDIFWRHQGTLTSSYGAGPSDMKEALEVLEHSPEAFLPYITHKLPLHDIQKGFELMLEPGQALKIIFQP